MRADKEKVSRLLKTARGQLDGVLRMIEDDRYCVDIANQILATESLLHKASREVLHAHMLGCVREAMQSEDADAKINEILNLVDKIAK